MHSSYLRSEKPANNFGSSAEFTSESLAIEVACSFGSDQVVEVLARIIHEFAHLRRNNSAHNESRPSFLFHTAPRATLARRASEENADGIVNAAPEAIEPLHFVPATPPLREVAGLTVSMSLT